MGEEKPRYKGNAALPLPGVEVVGESRYRTSCFVPRASFLVPPQYQTHPTSLYFLLGESSCRVSSLVLLVGCAGTWSGQPLRSRRRRTWWRPAGRGGAENRRGRGGFPL